MTSRKAFSVIFLSIFSLLPMTFLQASAASKHMVGVFCGSDEAIPDLYKEQALELGSALAKSGHGLITGGANTGLMSAVVNGFTKKADPLHSKGVIPAIFKNYNVRHPKIPECNLVWTDTIHERLQVFQEKCDAMVILPGGFGTLHELMDFMVPKQWGLMEKKIILLNTDHYWDHLLEQFKVMVEKKALKQKHLDLLVVVTSIEECIKAIQNKGVSDHQGLNDRYWEKSTK